MLWMLGVYAVGNFIFGCLAQKFVDSGKSTMVIILPAFLMFVVCQVGLALGLRDWAVELWLLASLTLAGAYAVYPLVTENFPSEYAARASSTLNLLVFASVFVMQWLIGVIIDGFTVSKNGYFSSEAYGWAFFTVIGLQLLSVGWYFMLGRKN